MKCFLGVSETDCRFYISDEKEKVTEKVGKLHPTPSGANNMWTNLIKSAFFSAEIRGIWKRHGQIKGY